jgi:hypothetical protein
MNFFWEDLIRRYELMSVTAIKKGIRNGRVGVMNFEGSIKNKTPAREPSIKEKIRSRFNRER